MANAHPYQVLLYYHYVPIEDPEKVTDEHLRFCNELGLKGRILIASEGINGTVSGPVEATQAYMDAMHQDPRFKDMEFKVDPHEGHAFKKMHVRHKKELVTFRVDKELDPNQRTGTRLSPEEFYQAMQDDEVVILDGRTGYEFDLGHFTNAIRPDVDSFREFPQWIRENLGDKKDKKILTYCTGGIRCEKLSAFMLEEGFSDVSQLQGGIVTYGKDASVKGDKFKGKCFVFDERISVTINQVNETVEGRCCHCNQPTHRYVNCSNNDCHDLHFNCEECAREYDGYCNLCNDQAQAATKTAEVQA
ncbi:rhodanese-related sulfurtransferase [Marininema halotolerans]|uniref:tRNA uridine(34) hydroxylase n=1 Tax=Marininema halotolerans TaxID=1155944 RepID=A0A1I6PU35_9BACL|nr:rhodanese-related sulfurtransferase [Marininema halotolerans]SFS43706.1 UPF0176 protein [Marininema halotolerans]